jgi:putative ABC transport system permease protein
VSLFALGLKALWRERSQLLFTSTGLAAVLGPLLLLYGFKFGVIAGLLTALREDPTNREVLLRGNHVLTAADIERYRGFPEVTFVLPASRTIAARMELVTPGPNPVVAGCTLVPSGAGDPLLPAGMVIESDQVALSASLAERLRVKAGDRIDGRNRRNGEHGSEQIEIEFTVVHVIDRRFAVGDRAYVSVDTVFRLEAFLDGYGLPDRGIAGKPISERPDVAENVRMYARSIEDVPALDKRLAALGFSVHSKADDVAGILGLNRSLAAVFGLIAALGSIG